MASAVAYEVEEAGGYVGLLNGGGGGGGVRGAIKERYMTARRLSSMSLRKKSAISSRVSSDLLRSLALNLQEVLLGTKLVLLFPSVPLAIAAHFYGFGQAWVFALSLLGLIPLAERLSFLTEQISFYTGPTVGGLLNATCGNSTELIIAIFALQKGNIDLVKYSLVGSVLSNLLLVLGTSLFCGGVANLGKEQLFDRKQTDANVCLLLLGALCHVLPLMFRYAVNYGELDVLAVPTLALSRSSSIVMLAAYIAYIFFQLKTHRQLFESQEKNNDDEDVGFEDEAVIGFSSAFAWLVAMECGSTTSLVENNEAMRRWKEMKQNFFAYNWKAPIPKPWKCQQTKEKDEELKRDTDMTKEEQAKISASGQLLCGLNSGIIKHVRNSK